jgi:hypothetical protein
MNSSGGDTVAATPDPLYTKLLEQGIVLLAAAVVTVGGALGGVLIYIYKQGQKGFSEALTSLENRIGEIAKSLSTLSEKLFERTDDHESRLSAMEAVCRDRHNGGQYPYRRKTDSPRIIEDP